MTYSQYGTNVLFEVEEICMVSNLPALLQIMSIEALTILLKEQEKQEKYEVCKIIQNEIERKEAQ